jgi:hypothetical protein
MEKFLVALAMLSRAQTPLLTGPSKRQNNNIKQQQIK